MSNYLFQSTFYCKGCTHTNYEHWKTVNVLLVVLLHSCLLISKEPFWPQWSGNNRLSPHSLTTSVLWSVDACCSIRRSPSHFLWAVTCRDGILLAWKSAAAVQKPASLWYWGRNLRPETDMGPTNKLTFTWHYYDLTCSSFCLLDYKT